MKKLTSAISEQHKDLFQWFLLHQEALLLNEDDLALASWRAFAEGLKAHIHIENALLFSDDYFQHDTWRWPANIYRKEHEKILKLLTVLTSREESYAKLTGRIKRLALLELLESQVQLRHVVEHHEEREEMDALTQLVLLDGVNENDVMHAWQAAQEWQLNHAALLQDLKQRFAE